MRKISLLLIAILLTTILPFSVQAAGHNAYIEMLGKERDECSVANVTETTNGGLHSLGLGNGAYILYRSVDFGQNGAFRADVRMRALMETPTYMPGDLELRLDGQFGKTVAAFKTDSSTDHVYSYELEEPITGVHDVYLVCLNKAIQFNGLVFQEYAEGGSEFAMYNEPDYLEDMQNTGKKDLIYTLIELGLIEPFMPNEYNPYIGITRGQYAVTIAKILGYSGAAEAQTGFLDIDPKSEYAGAVAHLQQSGVIFGHGDGSFNPDVYITVADALTMAVRALGYEAMVAASGQGYPAGYINMASRLDLTAGLTSADRLTRAELATLVDNIINANYLETVGLAGDMEQKEEIKGIMSKTRKLYKGRGLVRANSFTTLAAPVQTVSDGMVLIGDESFYVGETYAAALLGYDVTYYYKEDGEEKTLVSVSPTKNLRVTTAVTADGDEVSELSENQFNFYDAAEDENVSNKLDNKVHIIYNGKAIDNALDKLLESGSFSGRVRFIESSEPTLVIEEYVSVWAKTVQGSRNKIFDGLTETNMIFDADKEDIALFYKGVPILFSTLANNSVLTVYESKNQTGDKLIRINVSTAVEEGTVTAIEADRIYIDDYAYLKSKQATQDFWPGMQGYFLLNDCGEVVAYSEAVLAGEYRVGALTNFMIDTGINKVAKLQIFEDTNAFGEYDCAETVTIDGLKLKNADTIINGSAEFAGLANMSVQNTLIRYRANDSGQITMIDTHVTLGGGAEDTFTRLTGADAKFRFNGTSQLFTQAASGEYAIAPYKGTPALFGFKTAGDANTLFYGAKLTDYRSGSYAWNSESMTGEVYCLDKENPFVSHVIWQGAGGGTNWGYPFIVSEKSTIAINGETAVSIRGYRNNEACSFYIYSEEYKSNEPEMVNVRKILDYIQPGDALRVVASNEGEMKNCELMFLANGASVSPGGIAVKPNKDNGYGGLEAVSRLRATLFGEVVAVLDGFVQIEFAPDTYEYVKTTAGCMRYDYRNGKPVVENGLSIGEISIGDKVLYMAVDYQPRVLCIYEHPELD